ncbi:hypothetical protein ACFL6I_18220 [candidate division KSB1 bacterium]
MDVEKIKQILKKYLSFLGFLGRHSHSRMYHHWEIILAIFLFSNLLVLGFSLYLFLQINEGGIFLVEQSQKVRIDTIDRVVLQELLESFEIKNALFDGRSVSAPKVPDPSI